MPLTLTIVGADRTAYLVPSSLQLPDRMNQRSEASFTLRVVAGGWRPATFDPMSIRLDGVTIFEGFVWEPEEWRMVEAPGETGLTIGVNCVDLHLLCDRRIVADSFDLTTVATVVRALLTSYLTEDGVTEQAITTGPDVNVTRAVFNYMTLSEAFQDLAELSNCYWAILPGKRFVFQPRTSNVAPWVVNDTAKVKAVKVRRHREMYRNRQIVRAGYDLTSSRTESFRANGKNKTFTLAFPVGKKPLSIKVNGVEKTIGIRGLSASTGGSSKRIGDAAGDPLGGTPGVNAGGFDFYWQKNDPVISQDDSATPLLDTDILDVTYQGLFPVVIMQDNPAEILARATAELTGGVYESAEDMVSIDSSTAASEYAQAKLARYARPNVQVTFSTLKPGLKAGQLLTVNLPAHGLNNVTLMIEEANFQDAGLGQHGVWQYQIKATDSSDLNNWMTFWKNVFRQPGLEIRANEIVQQTRSAADGLAVGDTLSRAAAAPVRTVGSAIVGYSEVA